jgi:phospho-acceptor domain-containing protein
MEPLRESPNGNDKGQDAMSMAGTSSRMAEQNDLRTVCAIDGKCTDLLHDLNNVLFSILLNAQVLERKLPSYSRLKRNLHEIERNAQRGGELVKRLLQYQELPRRDEMTCGQACGELPVFDDISTKALGENPAIPTGAASSFLRPKAPSYSTSGFDSKRVPHTPM